MKNDRQLQEQVRSAIDACTRGLDNAPSLRHQVLAKAKGAPPVKKKFSAMTLPYGLPRLDIDGVIL